MKTNKYLRRLLFLALLPCLVCALMLPVCGEEWETEPYESMPEEYFPLLDSLPDEITDLFPEGLFSTDSGEVGEAVAGMSDFSYLLQTTLSVAGLKLKDCLRMLTSVCGLLLLSPVCKRFQDSFSSAGIARAFSFCSSLVITLGILMQTKVALEGVSNYFAGLGRLTASSVPLLGVLYAMGGNASAAAASAAGLSVYMTVLESTVTASILPFCGICMSFALVNALDPSIRLSTLLATLKKNYTTLLAFLMMLLLAMLGAQTTLGARSDTLTMRGVKFAVGNLIPVVGGSVSELLRSVSVGVGYLRGTVGICGILLILLYLLPTLTELFLLRLTWQLAASFADLLGCDGEKKLLDEFASVLGFLLSTAAICSSVILLAFSLLAHCAAAVGGGV